MECESEKKSGNHMVSLFGNDTVVDHSQSIVFCARTWTWTGAGYAGSSGNFKDQLILQR